MAESGLLTAGDVAAHCRVSYETVKRWVEGGKLKAFTTPGRHRRIRVDDFQAFLKTHGMPPFAQDRSVAQRVLIVDDDHTIVAMLKRFFALLGGCEVATAADGFEAGVQVGRFAPDVVLLDILMPGLDGFEVCRRIKADPDTSDTVVLLMTAYATPENRVEAWQCGADGFLAKPFELSELRGLMRERASARRPR